MIFEGVQGQHLHSAQSLDSMAANDFAGSSTDLNSACEIFDEQSHGQPKS